MRFHHDHPRVQFWQDYIVCEEGNYIYVDTRGNRSPITHEEARKKERDFFEYQASMDVHRGGADYEQAYTGRGFTRSAAGRWEYLSYKVDRLK